MLVGAEPKKLNEMSFEQRARDLEEQEREEQKNLGKKEKVHSLDFIKLTKIIPIIFVVVLMKTLKH